MRRMISWVEGWPSRGGFPLAGRAACAAQRSPAGAQLRFSAPQLQAADRFAACGTEVRSGSGAGLGQGTATVPVRMLRGGDGDCENADSVGDREAHAGAYCHSGGALTL